MLVSIPMEHQFVSFIAVQNLSDTPLFSLNWRVAWVASPGPIHVTRYGSRPDYHLPNTVAILAGYCESFIDAFDLPRVCEQRCKPLAVRME